MKLGIRLHPADLSLSTTISRRKMFGIERSRKAVHNWVEKANRQSVDGESPDNVTIDETVIQIENGRYWRYAAVAPELNHILHMRLYSGRTTALTEMFLRESKQYDINGTIFLIDGVPWLHKACEPYELRF